MIQYIKNIVLNFLSPPACAYCALPIVQSAVYCAACSAQLQKVVSVQVPITTTKSVTVFAAAAYKDPIKRLVLAKRWKDVIVTRHMAELIWELTPLQHMQFDYLVPIPLHWTRQVMRGYNQAEEIAKELAHLSGKPCVNILKRVRRTAYQSELSAVDRADNLANAFAVNTKDVEQFHGKTIVLVDDLYTTGATVKAAAKILYTLKPSSVVVVVACRVL